MPISDIVNVVITTTNPGPTQAGFGVPLIVSHSATWAERTRTYANLAAVLSDFAITTPEYLAASSVFSQIPAPTSLMIGRAANVPTQRYDIVPVVTNNTVYSLIINGQTVSYTSTGSATSTLIIDGLVTAIGAASPTLPVTATDVGSGTSLRIVSSGAAGAFVNVQASDTTRLSVKQTHADPGIAADLAAIALENNTWYGLITLFNSSALVAAAAAWVEANAKLYMAASCDGDIVAAGSSDIASTLQTSAYARTGIVFHPNPNSFADAALLGRCLPLQPGSETWKFKTLAGIPAVKLTGTQQAQLELKNCNYYYTVAGVNISSEGKTASGMFVDVVRGRDWLVARLQTRVFSLLINANKIPYTDAGIAMIETEVRAQMQEGIAVGLLASTPKPVVTVPLASAASVSDRAARLLRNVNFTAQLAGAIHSVGPINGFISV